MKVTRFVLLSALMWFVVGCPELEIPGEVAVSSSDCDADMDVDTDVDTDYAKECILRVYEETAAENCFYNKDIDFANVKLSEPLPECNDHCEVWLSGYDRCLDECWEDYYCDDFLFEYEYCVGTPVEPEGNCDEYEDFYRTCINTLGPDHYTCWVFQEELFHCWLQVEGGWCESLEGMYFECVDRFGSHHYGCQEIGWELSDDCGIWVEQPYDYPDCYYYEEEHAYCMEYYGEAGTPECAEYADILMYECSEYIYPVEDIDPDWDTDTDTDWEYGF